MRGDLEDPAARTALYVAILAADAGALGPTPKVESGRNGVAGSRPEGRSQPGQRVERQVPEP